MSTIAVNAITDANSGNTTTINGVTPNTSNVIGKNKIMNGAMTIDQRNAGAAVTTTSGYTLDRWRVYEQSAGAMSFQQVADAPDDFKYSLKATTTTADASVDASDYNVVLQRIEGTSVSDLNYGTSAAKTTTLSFHVKSSLTGTFGGSFRNNGGDRSYPFTYTISSANTWEKKTITIAGDTTGTWLNTTGMGLQVNFGLGVGTTYTGTSGAWVGAGNFSADSSVNVISTLNATWQVTGVQLEVGDTATEFEHRPYGIELGLCQRYYQQPIDSGLDFFAGYFVNGNYGPGVFDTWVVEMRTTPTVVLTLGSLNAVGSVSVNYFDKKRFHLNPTANATSNGFYYVAKLTADAEL
jgi:hypothetical protein